MHRFVCSVAEDPPRPFLSDEVDRTSPNGPCVTGTAGASVSTTCTAVEKAAWPNTRTMRYLPAISVPGTGMGKCREGRRPYHDESKTTRRLNEPKVVLGCCATEATFGVLTTAREPECVRFTASGMLFVRCGVRAVGLIGDGVGMMGMDTLATADDDAEDARTFSLMLRCSASSSTMLGALV
jgi:hypothetical protein